MVKIIHASQVNFSQYTDAFADLMHATGPVTYDYQFNGRALFDHIVKLSWRMPGTLFAYDGTTLALEGDKLVGIEVGFHGPEFATRKKALGALWPEIIEAGHVTTEELGLIAERTFQCSYLNAAIPKNVYYTHALSVDETRRGKGIGAKLIRNALAEGRRASLRALHLDVLSDNPAVDFYKALDFQCLVESTAPIPLQHGIPMEMRMSIDL